MQGAVPSALYIISLKPIVTQFTDEKTEAK